MLLVSIINSCVVVHQFTIDISNLIVIQYSGTGMLRHHYSVFLTMCLGVFPSPLYYRMQCNHNIMVKSLLFIIICT